VDASTLETIESSFQDIARDSGAGNTAQDALRWFSQQRKEWLVLFDNADNPNVNLRKLLPPCNHGNVIITTRNEACHLHAPDSNHLVSGMNPDEAVNLLLTSAMMEPSQQNRSLTYPIVQELGYLALAIAQVGATYHIPATSPNISQSTMRIVQRCFANMAGKLQMTTSGQYTPRGRSASRN
jgi:hypothetical protein